MAKGKSKTVKIEYKMCSYHERNDTEMHVTKIERALYDKCRVNAELLCLSLEDYFSMIFTADGERCIEISLEQLNEWASAAETEGAEDYTIVKMNSAGDAPDPFRGAMPNSNVDGYSKFTVGFPAKSSNKLISGTLPHILKKIGGSGGGLLKGLYISLLKSNSVVDEENNLVANYNDPLIEMREVCPYGWKVPPVDSIPDVLSGAITYQFLAEIPSIRKNSVTINLSRAEEDIFKLTLPFLSSRLWRSRSDLFKMLYVYFLKSNDLLAKDFSVPDNFIERVNGKSKLLNFCCPKS